MNDGGEQREDVVHNKLKPRMNSSIQLAITSLALVTFLILIIQSSQSSKALRNHNPSLSLSKSDATILQSMDQKRSMVGGYSTVDDPSAQVEMLPIAEYALGEFATRQSAALVSSSSSNGESSVVLAVTPSQVESKEIIPIIVQAQRQVVAGMNYKLTIGLVMRDGNECLGGFKVTVWKQLSGELKATNWGHVLSCREMEEEFGHVLNAMRVEGEMMMGGDGIEPEK
ncbi:hypothetical protein ACHAWO_000085 [Cyclotella atomus]|uniref:Cysteine proteinase inhibitor n=1 Tax=Cyclotella atomus TaxID=382360 RepID=A0ABD3P0P0_9STRA